MNTKRTRPKRPLALLASIGIGFMVLAGCGNGGDGDPTPTEQVSSPSTEDDTGDEAVDRSDLPDDFPEDIPLPDYSAARASDIAGSSMEGWMVVLTVRGEGDSVVDDYAEVLTNAGFTPMDEGNGQISAEGESWSLTAHSTSSGFLTLTVVAK